MDVWVVIVGEYEDAETRAICTSELKAQRALRILVDDPDDPFQGRIAGPFKLDHVMPEGHLWDRVEPRPIG